MLQLDSTYIGIDVGLQGAIACITPHEILVFDTPTFAPNKSSKRVYLPYRMAWMIEELRTMFSRHGTKIFVALESAHAMPKQGVSSMFAFGRGLGLWEGILASKEIPYELITPQRWKKAMLNGTGKDKNASRLQAVRLFPSVSSDLNLKRHHGRAEALLLAEYARRAGL